MAATINRARADLTETSVLLVVDLITR